MRAPGLGKPGAFLLLIRLREFGAGVMPELYVASGFWPISSGGEVTALQRFRSVGVARRSRDDGHPAIIRARWGVGFERLVCGPEQPFTPTQAR